ncbi:hypothetical protein BV898_12734, partial [Hypsibius exemplaris]
MAGPACSRLFCFCVFLLWSTFSIDWSSQQDDAVTTAATPAAETAQFRFTANLTSVKYQPALGNIDNLDFKLAGHEIAERFTALLQDKPGKRITVVEKFQDSGNGSLVGVHLTSTEFTDPFEIDSRIKVALKSGNLGRFKSSELGYTFAPTTEPANKTTRWQCPPDSFWCEEGSCIPLRNMCDKVSECPDGSDEANSTCEPSLVEVIVHPKTLTLQAGQRAQFFCGSNDFRHRVKWFRNNVPVDNIQKANVLQKKGRLQIVQVVPADSGLYECKALHSLEGSEASVRLTVVPRSNGTGDVSQNADAELTVTVIEGIEGSAASVTCVPEEGVTIEWSKIEGRLPDGATVVNGTLTIPKLSMGDAGFYECFPSTADPADDAQSVAQIIVVPVSKTRGELAVRKRYIPVIAPANLTITESEPFSFHCTSTKDGVNVEWARSLLRMPKSVKTKGGNLTSETSVLADTGKYYCKHRGGTASERAAAILTVLPKKYPTVTPVNLTVTELEPFSFECESTRPGVPVFWSRDNGTAMPETEDGRTDSGRTEGGRTDSGRTEGGRTGDGRTDSGRFASESASKEDAGEYFCTHNGTVKGERTVTYLTVFSRKFPVITRTWSNYSVAETRQFNGSDAETQSEQFNMTITEGESFSYECSSTRDGVSTVWTRGDNQSMPESFSSVNGTLISGSAAVEDSGLYNCGHDGRTGEIVSTYLTVLPRQYPVIIPYNYTSIEYRSSWTVQEGGSEIGFNAWEGQLVGRGGEAWVVRGKTEGVEGSRWQSGERVSDGRHDGGAGTGDGQGGRDGGAGTGGKQGGQDGGGAGSGQAGRPAGRTTGGDGGRTTGGDGGRTTGGDGGRVSGGDGRTGPEQGGTDGSSVPQTQTGPRAYLAITEGEPFGYECIATRENITAAWVRDGASLGTNLTSSAATFNDTGDYFCEHSGREGERVSLSLTVLRRRFPVIRPANETVAVAESWSNETSTDGQPSYNLTITEGESFSYECVSTRENATAEWTQADGLPLSNGLIADGGNLSSSAISINDTGDYFCGHEGRKGERAVLHLNVVRRRYPSIRPANETVTGGTDGLNGTSETDGKPPTVNVTVTEGEAFSYQCVSSRDEVLTEWRQENGSLPAGFVSTDGKLTSPSVSLNASGEYTCGHVGRPTEEVSMDLIVIP